MLSRVLLSSLLALAAASPQVKLGDAILVGRDVTLLKQDFFGGNTSTPVPSLIHDILCSDPLCGTSAWKLTLAISGFEDRPRERDF